MVFKQSLVLLIKLVAIILVVGVILSVDTGHAHAQTLGLASHSHLISPSAAAKVIVLPRATAKAKLLERISVGLFAASQGYLLLLLWLLLKLRISNRFRDFALRCSKNRLAHCAIYLGAVTVALAVAMCPFSFVSGWLLPHEFGLSTEAVFSWVLDWGKNEALSYALTVPVVCVVFGLVNRYRRWWFSVWLLLMPLILISIVAEPLVIDPLFNHYSKLPAGSLHDRIEALASKAGVPNAPIYVVDKSKQTNTTNAYVTGLLGSARIVIWDTTLGRMPDNEVVAIVGHEMGHYVEKHIWIGYAITVLVLLGVLPLCQCVYEVLLKRQARNWGISSTGDIAAYPLMLMIVTSVSLLLMPFSNWVSRKIEHRADAFSLRITHDPTAMAHALIDLSTQNLSDPDPPMWIVFFFYTHPPMRERVEFVLSRPVPDR